MHEEHHDNEVPGEEIDEVSTEDETDQGNAMISGGSSSDDTSVLSGFLDMQNEFGAEDDRISPIVGENDGSMAIQILEMQDVQDETQELEVEVHFRESPALDDNEGGIIQLEDYTVSVDDTEKLID